MSCPCLKHFWLMFSNLGIPTAEQCPSGTLPDESPLIMEALEHVLTVLPPGTWDFEGKEPRGQIWLRVLSPLCCAGTISAPVTWSCSRAGLPHPWPVRHQVPQECDKSLTTTGASTSVSLVLPARGRTTGIGVKLQGAGRARLSMSQVPRGK